MTLVVSLARALLAAGGRDIAADAVRYLLGGGDSKADRYAHALFYGVLLVIGVGTFPLEQWPLSRVAYEATKWLVWGAFVGVGGGTLVKERAALVEFAHEEHSDRGVR